jgi:hypothetical protein
LAVALLLGTLSTAGMRAAAADEDDIEARLKAIPGLTILEEKPTSEGFRFFILSFTQYADHRRPTAGTFQQRLTLLHRGFDRPMVFSPGGYYLYTDPWRSEPTRLVDGNEISTEHRFFVPSRPQPADWSKLTIWQAATDHHRIVTALRSLYTAKWISTGISRDGQSAVYHRRFYPGDVAGTIAYSAPNDVIDIEDSARDRFFQRVGTESCRKAVENIQIEALRRRAELVPKYAAWAKENNFTFDRYMGDVHRAFEYLVADFRWYFWQSRALPGCASIPTPKDSSDTILAWFKSNFDAYPDQSVDKYVPYYYHAATQVGWPDVRNSHLVRHLKYPRGTARDFVPKELPAKSQPLVMLDIDLWVKLHGRNLLFIYSQNDPWSAEPFRLGLGTRDSRWYEAEGGTHGAGIDALTADEQSQATKTLLRWAGVPAVTSLRSRTIDALDYDRPERFFAP